MPLLQEIRYETEVKSLKDISPQSVLSVLNDVRESVSELEPEFEDFDLTRVLEVVESGKYELSGRMLTRIDLSSAKLIIDTYRKYSEGGCQSCVNLGRETIDAQDATSGEYCRVSDPDFDENAVGDRRGVRYEGFSPKVNRYFKNPCNDWEPRFSPTIEKLIE